MSRGKRRKNNGKMLCLYLFFHFFPLSFFGGQVLLLTVSHSDEVFGQNFLTPYLFQHHLFYVYVVTALVAYPQQSLTQCCQMEVLVISPWELLRRLHFPSFVLRLVSTAFCLIA